MKRALAAAVAVVIVGTSARADVKMPAIFGSHMVLQQKQADKVWGWADPGEEVTVTIADQTKTAKAGDDKKWAVTLDPMNADNKPLTLTVKGNNTITFDDVLVGEVWICSGQSNMQFNVNSSNDADLEIQGANFPEIRLITVPLVGTQTPQDDFKGEWALCSPQTVPGFSAVGYYFGRQLYETLHVPIGLIHDSWGGSSCETWVNKDVMVKDGKYTELIERWKGKEADTGNQQPGNLYNGMILPVLGLRHQGGDLVSRRDQRGPRVSVSRPVPADDPELARRLEDRRLPVLLGPARRLHGRKPQA